MEMFNRVPDLLTRKFRTPTRVIHHELARPSENLMVDREGRPHRETRVPRRRLNIDTLKRRAIENLPIREAVECDATRQTQRLLPGFLRQCGPMRGKDFFQCSLHARRNILMPMS